MIASHKIEWRKFEEANIQFNRRMRDSGDEERGEEAEAEKEREEGDEEDDASSPAKTRATKYIYVSRVCAAP